MRLAYLTHQYPHPHKGYVADEIRALEARGTQVERFSLLPAEGRRRPGTLNGEPAAPIRVIRAHSVLQLFTVALVTLWSRPVPFFTALRLALRIARNAQRRTWGNLMQLAEACMLLQEFQARRVEHVHAHGGTDAATVALLCRTLGGPPYSFVAHGPVEFDNPQGSALEDKIRSATFVLADGAFGRTQLLRSCGHEHWDKVHVVRPVVHIDPRDTAHRPAVALQSYGHQPLARFVCLGRICEPKGQRILVEAAALLAEERLAFEIVMIGDGPLRNEIEALARLRGLSSRVRFIGAPREDLADRIAGAKALILPSLSEGLPTPVLEAFALSRPVIATSVAGVPEFVEHGVNGWLVEPGSVAALADALRDAIRATPERVAELGAAGLRRVAERHSPDAESARLLHLYQDSIREARGRSRKSQPAAARGAAGTTNGGRPKVSVVIVNWNRGDDVIWNLRHLQRLDYPNLEIIVVDNGSTDGSTERLARLPGLSLIRLGENLGPSKARNVGIQAASGKYVLFLDSDAVLAKRALPALVARMEADPSIGIAGCKIMNWHSRKIDQWIYAEPYETHGNTAFDSYSFSAAGAMCRAEALRDVGGFWERLFIYNEEVDLSIRMLRGGYRIVFAPDARVFHRPANEGRASSSNYLRLQIRNWIWIYFRYYPRLVCWWKVASYSAIYLVKGAANREFLASVRGIVEGLRHTSIIREYDDKLSYEEVGLIDSLNRRTAIRLRR